MENLNHNNEVLQSEMITTKLENESLLYEKQALYGILDETNDSLKITKQEIKDLNKKLKEQVSYISKIEAELNIKDTVEVKNDSIIYIDNTPAFLKFSYMSEWLKLNGDVNIKNNTTHLYDISIPVPLTVGLTKDMSIFVTSDNPYLQVTDINATALQTFVDKNKKRKHWGFGIYAGWGIQYGILNKILDTGPQLGVGVMYRF